LADDVNFRALAEAYPRSGGDIKNAVLKAAQIATTEPGPDEEKRIHQHHFVLGMEEVIAAEAVMGQSLFNDPSLAPLGGALEQISEGQDQLRAEVALVVERLDTLERSREQSRVRRDTDLAERRRRARVPLYISLVALVLAAAAVVISFIDKLR
jgi:hypothetical protein